MATEWSTFFLDSKPPENYASALEQMTGFIIDKHNTGTKIALVTSGGTTVPLESQTVRFIDNFSVGTRGSASVEYFLKHDYAVIFLHRRGSLEPFKRHFMQANFLDMLELTDQGQTVNVRDAHHHHLVGVLKEYEEVKRRNLLLSISFTTLSDYLFLLKGASELLQRHSPGSLMYLAAAVSDFYIPAQEMPQHKIQSGDGPLQLSLQLVPKMLSPLVSQWAPDAFVVSFKLETDPTLLSKKAMAALERYKHSIVIGNILKTRKKEVTVVTPNSQSSIMMTEEEITSGKEIEEKIINEITEIYCKK